MAEKLSAKILKAIEDDGMTKDEAKSLAKALKKFIGESDEEPDDEEGVLPILQTMQEAMAKMGKRVEAMEKLAAESNKPPKKKGFFESFVS